VADGGNGSGARKQAMAKRMAASEMGSSERRAAGLLSHRVGRCLAGARLVVMVAKRTRLPHARAGAEAYWVAAPGSGYVAPAAAVGGQQLPEQDAWLLQHASMSTCLVGLVACPPPLAASRRHR
jgi:hypothetical protein